MLSELDVMKSLQPHPHVVKLIGCCVEKGNGQVLLTEQISVWENHNHEYHGPKYRPNAERTGLYS